MRIRLRPSAPARFVAIGLLLAALAGCGALAEPSTPAVTASPVASPVTNDPAARAAYAAALCPIVARVLDMDPRLEAMRSAGTAGGDMTAQAQPMASLADDLLVVLTDLEAVPEWGPGQRFRYELITALHGIRAHILFVNEDLADAGAAEAMATIPFVASDAMDRALATASAAGLACGEGS
jgi:hypothetical protein